MIRDVVVFFPDGTKKVETKDVPDFEPHTPETMTDRQQIEHELTSLDLRDIAQGQVITDLELMILEGQANV